MNVRILALSALAILAANGARAAVYFDTISNLVPSGSDGPASDQVPVMAESFYAPGTPNFSQISLTLSAGTPTDGGFFKVYLVPDSGSGGATGLAGSPTYSGGTNFAGYNNAVLLGTYADSYLAQSGSGTSLVTVNVPYAADAAVAANTQNNEYWIGLVPSNTSSVEWYFNVDGGGAGSANQGYFNNISGSGGDGLGVAADESGAYQMLVDTPEPGTLAILGGGLAAMGCVRRRSVKKV